MLSLNLTHLIDDAKCYETVRQMRWPSGVCCPKCKSSSVIKRGKDETQAHRQRYQCKSCGAHFDDLSHTIFAVHHQPLRMWILCLYLMGLNRSNRQIAQELDLDKDVVQDMTTQLRHGIIQRNPDIKLSGAVECDEVYVHAGHKGNPEAVLKKGEQEDDIGRQKAVEYSSRFIAFSKGFGAGARLRRKSPRYSG
jgi:transposase-like protein